MAGEIDIMRATRKTISLVSTAQRRAPCSTTCELTLFQDDGDFDISVTSGESDKFSWTADGGKLTLTGLASTMGETADEPVEVEVTAEDDDGLSLELNLHA